MSRILNNQDIRDLMSEYGFRQYEVADKIGINVSTLVRWLQLPLTPDHRIRVFKAIKELQEEEHKKQLAVKQWFEQQYGNIDLSGKKTTALSLSPAPNATARFGIGGSTKDYNLFYDYLEGKNNDYGKVLIYTGKTISKKKNINSLFAVADGSTSENAKNYYGKNHEVYRESNNNSSSSTNRNVGAML